MTITIDCPCGSQITLASGFNADVMPEARKVELARAAGWNFDPPVCPECIGNLFVCHECGTRADCRTEDPTGSGGACKNCGTHKWTEGTL